MAALDFNLTFAGVPFFSDDARPVRLSIDGTGGRFLAKQQPEDTLLDDVDRLFPFDWTQEFGYSNEYPGRDFGALAHLTKVQNEPGPKLRVGEYYYPNGARKWSYFRGLATSSQVKAMVAATQGSPATFLMNSQPQGGGTRTYGISTSLYLLPPRPLGEQAGQFDGLYLVTLVDERWHWQFKPVDLSPDSSSTWASLIATVATALGASVTYSSISSAYGTPEPDSQLWARQAPAALLLDTLAANVGMTVVRNYDGTYKLYTTAESLALSQTSRRDSSGRIVRLMGGDSAGGASLPAGDLSAGRKAVLPATVRVSFPKYVSGDDPIPHYLNARGQATRHYEDGYGDRYSVDVSGGGISGVRVINTTAKALYATEAAAFGGAPTNATQLTALSSALASDLLAGLTATGLDESYLGVFPWTPDGLHDVLFTYSASRRTASTRAVRQEWNADVREFQHGTPGGASVNPKGQQGPPPPLTVRDTQAGGSTWVSSGLQSGGSFLYLNSGSSGFPTTRRWKGQFGGESVLFEAFSGTGANSGGAAPVTRGIDGTAQASHTSGGVQVLPNVGFLTNLITFESPLRTAQGVYTSGGVQEMRVYMGGGVTTATSSTATLTADQNDYVIPNTSSIVSLTLSSQDVSITGIMLADDQTVTLAVTQASTFSLLIPDESTSSLTTNRIVTPTQQTLVIPAGGTVTLWKDPVTHRVFVTGVSTVPCPHKTAQTATLTTSQNDYPLTGGTDTLVITATSSNIDLTGLKPVSPDQTQTVTIVNDPGSTKLITLKYDSGSSTAADRFLFPDASDLVLRPGTSVTITREAGSVTKWGRPGTPTEAPWNPTFTGTVNNPALTTGRFPSLLLPTLSGDAVLTGFPAGFPVGVPLVIQNPSGSGHTLTIAQLNGGSTIDFDLSTGADKILSPGESLTVSYDGSVISDVAGSLSLSSSGGSSVTITEDSVDAVSITSDTTWTDLCTLSLAAGTYLLTSVAAGNAATMIAGGWIELRIFNSTDSAQVGKLTYVVSADSANVNAAHGTGSVSAALTLSGSKTIKLQVQRTFGPTWTVSAINHAAMQALKIA